MRIVALEEHYLDPDIAAASAPLARELSPHFAAAYDPGTGHPYSPPPQVLRDLGEGRLADMDANGISMQVLSCLSTQQVPANVAVDLVRNTNNRAPGRPRWACRSTCTPVSRRARSPTSATRAACHRS